VKKIIISRALATEKLGSSNVHAMAENLYTTLYDPEKMKTLVESNSKYPDRLDVFGAHLRSCIKQIPDKEDFVATVKHVLTREVDFEKLFSNIAKEQFRSVAERSELTVLWTDGDDLGVPDRGIPGSREQIRKVGGAKFFNQVRREIAQNREDADPGDIVAVIATEGKMRFIPDVAKHFKKRGIRRIVIVEDRLENLRSARDLIDEISSDMETFLVLIRHDQNSKEEQFNSIESDDAVHAIENISELMALLEKKNIFSKEVKVGTIFDMDGVLSDDSVRKKLQADALIDAFERNGWITL